MLSPDFKRVMKYIDALQNDFPEVAAHIRDFLQDVVQRTTMTSADMQAILQGAFTVIDGDGGYFRDKYEPHQYKRVGLLPMSSHGAYLSRQYRMGAQAIVSCGTHAVDCGPGAAVRINPHFDLLVGVDKSGNTAFQFERTRRDTVAHALQHSMDYLKYTGAKDRVNLGAFGTSAYTDARPLRLYLCSDAAGRVCKPLPKR
jgi:hypothetical protein